MARTKRYHGSISARGTGYRVSLCIRGQRHRQLEGFPAPITMSALFDRFERDYLPGVTSGTQGAYRDVLKVVRPYFLDRLQDPQVDRVRKGQIAGYLIWRRG